MSRLLVATLTLVGLAISPPAARAQQPSLAAQARTSAAEFRDQTGRRLTFICPSNVDTRQDIYGTDVYTDTSPICAAAAHAGVFAPGTTASVTILMGGEAVEFIASMRNGVQSLAYGTWRSTYTFVKDGTPGQIDWYTTLAAVDTSYQTPITLVCPSGGQTDAGVVWGTDIYSSDSAICVAAVHGGVIQTGGGAVTVTRVAKQASLSASTQNGVTSRGWSDPIWITYPQPYRVAQAPPEASAPASAGAIAAGPVTTTSTAPASATTTVTATPMAPVTGALAAPVTGTAAPMSCNAVITAKATSTTSAKVSWSTITQTCPAIVAAPSGFLFTFMRGDASQGGSACPVQLDSTFSGQRLPYSSTRYTSCFIINILVGDYPELKAGSLDDYGLNPGVSYIYRVVPMRQCTSAETSSQPNACVDGFIYFPHTDATVAIPFGLTGPDRARRTPTQVPPPIGLKGSYGTQTCPNYVGSDSHAGECQVPATFTWNPVANAAGYIYYAEFRDPAFWAFVGLGSQNLPATAASYKTTLPSPGIVRVCVAAVMNSAAPPDPRAGECIEKETP